MKDFAATNINEIPKRKFVINDCVPKNQLTIFAGNDRSGKTTLTAGMVHALSTGRDFAGLETSKQVCYLLTSEGGDYLKQMITAHNLAIGGGSEYTYNDMIIDLTTEKGLLCLKTVLVENRANNDGRDISIFFDNFQHFFNGHEKNGGKCVSVLGELNQLLKQFPEATFIATAYSDTFTNKEVVGSIAFVQHSSTIYHIGIFNKELVISPRKTRFHTPPKRAVPIGIYGDPSNHTDAQYLKY